MFFKKYELNFTLVPTIAFLVAFVCFIQLGFWQLERASEKNNINDNYTLRQDDSLINLNSTNSINNKEAILWRRTEVNGSFLNKKNIYIGIFIIQNLRKSFNLIESNIIRYESIELNTL